MDYTNLKESEFAQNYDQTHILCDHFKPTALLTEEIAFIDKQIRSAEISLYQAQQRPNTPLVDITNLERKLDLLHNIRNVLVEKGGAE